jgi:predicted XRE-type DNA-binding protein
VKIRSIKANNHKHAFDVAVSRGVMPFPYAKADPVPTSSDPIVRVYVDEELGREGFTYVLRSGAEGSVHVDWVLEYNEDPAYMRDLLLYDLTVRAQDCMKSSPLAQAEILRRAKTSASQAARLLDTTNRTKSVDKLLVLLAAMDCEVEFRVRPARTRKGGAPQQRGCRRAPHRGSRF